MPRRGKENGTENAFVDTRTDSDREERAEQNGGAKRAEQNAQSRTR